MLRLPSCPWNPNKNNIKVVPSPVKLTYIQTSIITPAGVTVGGRYPTSVLVGL